MNPRRVDRLMDAGIAAALGLIVGAVAAALLLYGCGAGKEPMGARGVVSDTPRRTGLPGTDGGADGSAGLNPAGRPPSLRRLFDAIRQVESSGDDRAVGDGGRSRGPYQCGREAWADGGGNPADYDRLVWDRAACERVMVGYWRRYGCETDEQRARMWNGGPRGMEKSATLAYWRKVKEAGDE